jgi:hypothetical protein
MGERRGDAGPPGAGAGLRPLRLDDLRQSAGPTPWLWRGYLVRGAVTLLTSQWKSGKTTLLALLLNRLRGGGVLAGLPVSPGRAAVVSEEGPQQWYRRSERLAFGEHVCWFCRPFRGKPRLAEWLGLLDLLAGLHQREGLDLVAIDPLAAFLPGRDENSAAAMLEALLPLQALTARGLAVLVLHHPRKGEPAPGQAARGSGALAGYVDILVEMSWYGRAEEGDRRRRLQAWSRYEETPPNVVMELNAEGTDYAALGDTREVEHERGWGMLRTVLEEATRKLTRPEILAEWPPDWERPDGGTLWRWLERAVAAGQVERDGLGRKGQPYRYWLKGQAERWQAEEPYGADLPYLEEFWRQQAEAEELYRRMTEGR